MTTPVLYRIYDETGRLIYIGSTGNLQQRLNTHRTSSWWFALVHRVKARPYPTLEGARVAERTAIAEEGPAFNLRAPNGGYNIRPRMTDADVTVCREWLASKKDAYLRCSMRWVQEVSA